MNNLPKFPNSDDEEDIEALRLAALQSLKKPPHQENSQPFLSTEQHSQTWHGKGFRNKRGKFFGAHSRGGKTGHYGRERSTTLISITTVDDQLKDKNPTEKPTSVNEESTSKFARYDKSDESESESEEEVGGSEEDGPGKLKRADSLEALMQELDDEIQGKSSVKERKEVKVKKVKKKKRASENENKIPPDAKALQLNGSEKEKPAEEKLQSSTETTTSTSSEVAKVENEPEVTQAATTTPPVKVFNKKPLRSRSPGNRRGFYNRRKQRNYQMSQNQPPLLPFPPIQYAPPVLPYPEQHPFNPSFVPAMNMVPQMQPIFYERPPSPLAINTESLTTVTMAPLSPRSAAFVLENKAIVERRKRSPRRSYSRSISRSPRRSLTPRRSPRRSLSPRKSRSPRRPLMRKRSLSPRRKSLSPKRRSLSPKRRNIDRGAGGDSKAPLRDRLGVKNKSDEGIKDTKTQEDNTKKDEKPLDPILEARKRKFETNEIKLKEGIIRLRPKEDKPREEETKQEKVEAKVIEAKSEEKVKKEKPKENIVEVAPATTTVEEKPLQKEKDLVPDEFKELEMLLNDEIMLEPEDVVESPKVDDIFSDEDSASDNEGRFKIKEQQSAKPPVLSYLKLVNGEKTEIKTEPLLLNTRIRHERNLRERSKRKIRSMTPPLKKSEPRKEEEKKKVTSMEKTSSKHKISPKSDKRPPSMDKRFERKIEIKIKNPSKYERNSKSKGAKIEENIPSKVEKKLKLEKEESDNDEGFEPEIIIENDSDDDDDDDDEYLSVNEGDLRAQLSKKRAEKLHKIPSEGVPSRFLKFALQDTILKKKKKKSKDPESKLSSSECPAVKKLIHEESRKFYLSVRTMDKIRFSYSRPLTDGRLPIHLRLGIASSSEIFAESRSKRKSRKRKNRELLEQKVGI